MVTSAGEAGGTAADPRIEAEAAAWLARLRGPQRSPQAERAFRAWLAADPRHEDVFSRATELWDLVGGAGAPLDRAPQPWLARRPLALAAALAALACLAGGGAVLMRDPTYHTRIGEQQSVVLSDGTRMTLNTDSRVVVRYSAGLRRVKLDRGEAMFEVAKNPRRPFIVVAAGEQVRALGTVFTVRRDGPGVAVTLIEGRVSVSEKTGASPRLVAMLAPGQRLTVRPDAGSAVDRPRLEAVTAWRRGQVVFDDTSLLDAAQELNRYGGRRILVGDPSVGSMRISGIFSASDPDTFAAVASQALGLSVHADDRGLVLTRARAAS